MTRLLTATFERALTLAAIAAFAAGCGGGGDSPPPPNITPSGGGTVTSADNKAKLIVPPGAAAVPMIVTLTAAPNAPRPSDVGFAPGGFYEIGGNGTMLAADADYEVEPESPTPQAARVRRMDATGAFGCDTDGDADIDDLLADGPCIQPRAIAKLSPNAAIQIGNCVSTVTKLVCKLRDLGPGLWGVLFDNVAPTVTIASVSVTEQDANGRYVVRTPSPVTVTVNAADDVGVTRVEFYRNNVLIGQDTSAPYTQPFGPFTAADVGVPQTFVAHAFDAANNASSPAQVVVTVSAAPPQIRSRRR